MLSFLFISHFVFESVQVQGFSMYPTLFNTNFYWLNKFAYVVGQPHRGDVVAIKDPGGHGFDVKRIIATPDQSIFISHGKVYINGEILRESLTCRSRCPRSLMIINMRMNSGASRQTNTS